MIVGAVVLAAGKSERMGKNKLLLRFGGKLLLQNVLDALTIASINDQVLVVGHKPGEIIGAVRSRLNTLKIGINANYEQGMTSSFQKGLQSLPHVDAAFLVLGDEPIFNPKVLRFLIEKMEKSRGEALIVSPIHRGKRGHPLLFHSQLFPEIRDLKNPQTIRNVVYRHADKLVTVRAPRWTVMDIDTPQDYNRISKSIKTSPNL
jgi:molybdenum cofactor cytidylyltransferase